MTTIDSRVASGMNYTLKFIALLSQTSYHNARCFSSIASVRQNRTVRLHRPSRSSKLPDPIPTANSLPPSIHTTPPSPIVKHTHQPPSTTTLKPSILPIPSSQAPQISHSYHPPISTKQSQRSPKPHRAHRKRWRYALTAALYRLRELV